MLKDSFKNVSAAFIIIPVVLSLLGLIFIYSTGVNPDGSNNNHYLKQLIWIVIGVGMALLIINIDYYRLVETSVYFYIAGIVLLVITLIFGKEIRNSKSWLGIAGMGIQPSEIMKICYILFFARYLSNAPINERKTSVFFISLLFMIIPLALILLQPDLGTAIVFVAIFIVMSYLGMSDDSYVRYMIFSGIISAVILFGIGFYKYYLEKGGASLEVLDILLSFNTLLIVSITMFLYSIISLFIDFFTPVPIIKKILPITFIIGISFLFSAVAVKTLKPYHWKRILVMISPEFDRKGSGYNIIQSKIAIGSGGFFGKGLFRGTQNILGFLPEKHTDFIYSIISEELGFFGSSIIILIFTIYFYYITKTIQSAKDKEGMLIASGVLAMLFTHFFVNIGMTLGITPAAGLPLPFVSYGGSSYIACIIAAALLSNIYSRRFVH